MERKYITLCQSGQLFDCPLVFRAAWWASGDQICSSPIPDRGSLNAWQHSGELPVHSSITPGSIPSSLGCMSRSNPSSRGSRPHKSGPPRPRLPPRQQGGLPRPRLLSWQQPWSLSARYLSIHPSWSIISFAREGRISTGRSADRLARTVRVREVGGSNPLAPTGDLTVTLEGYP
jgi:hypothetical protein